MAVLNLGFDRKGQPDVHWMYFPDRSLVFYLVDRDDSMLPPRPGTPDRLSLYVEIGAPSHAVLSEGDLLARILGDLRRERIVIDHQLVSYHHVVFDPACVHIT